MGSSIFLTVILVISIIILFSVAIYKSKYQSVSDNSDQDTERLTEDDIKRAIVKLREIEFGIDARMDDEEFLKLIQKEGRFIRITKLQAKKLISQGKQVFCAPNKSTYNDSIYIYLRDVPSGVNFNKFCNQYKNICCIEEDNNGRIAWFTNEENVRLLETETGKKIIFYKEGSRFEPRQRTALDGKVWWVVYDRYREEFSSLTCFGRYKTKKACQSAIDNYGL